MADQRRSGPTPDQVARIDAAGITREEIRRLVDALGFAVVLDEAGETCEFSCEISQAKQDVLLQILRERLEGEVSGG